MSEIVRNSSLRGRLETDVRLSNFTSWRVGGKARYFYDPADLDDLVVFFQQLDPEEETLWLGLGSNLLVRDGGFSGTVVHLHQSLKAISSPQWGVVYAEAGVPAPILARFAARNGWLDGAFWAGIPGTVGGALAMNAGAFGGETWERVRRVWVLDDANRVRLLDRNDFSVGYRRVQVMKGAIKGFLAAEFAFSQMADSEAALRSMRAMLSKRAVGQPTGQASCGSVFKNPENDSAGRLIEACGLKGMQLGGAMVSEQHANFIINREGATAASIEQLIRTVQSRVLDQTGIFLEPEVRLVGDVEPIV